MTSAGAGSTPHAVAIVAAAGVGLRLGRADREAPKALLRIGGRPLLDLALAGLVAAGIEELVVVHPPGQRDAFAAVTRPHGPAALVAGGPTRAESVRAGVAAVEGTPDLFAVHDAARPLTPPAVIRRAIAAVTGDVIAAAPGLAVPDTLKRVDGDGRVVRTVDRRDVWAAHTPQVVRADVLRRCLGWVGEREVTDDLGLVEIAREAGAVSGAIVLVPGDPRDLKITYPADVDLATAVVASGWPGGG